MACKVQRTLRFWQGSAKAYEQTLVGICHGGCSKAPPLPRNFTDHEQEDVAQPACPRAEKVRTLGSAGFGRIDLVGCSSGMVALVGGTDAEEEAFTRLTHPKPVVALQKKVAHPVLLRSQEDAGSKSDDESQVLDRDASPAHASEEASMTPPAPSPKPEPKPEAKLKERDKTILPCSVCKKTMRVPRNPYTSHQRAARSLPNSFFVKTTWS